VQFGADLYPCSTTATTCGYFPSSAAVPCKASPTSCSCRAVDIGVVRADSLDYLEKKGIARDLRKQLTYVTKLYNEEMQVIAPVAIRNLRDLDGKRVSVDLPDGSTFVTALAVFERLGLQVNNFAYIEQRIAMEKLKKGELDAVIVVGGKPYKSVSNFVNDGRFHLVTVDYDRPLQGDYLPATLTSKDYPNLIADGDKVDTSRSRPCLPPITGAPNTDRYRKLSLFVDAFFTKFPTLQNPPFHPKWKEVSLAAPLPGWQRLPSATKMAGRKARASERRAQPVRRVHEDERRRPGRAIGHRPRGAVQAISGLGGGKRPPHPHGRKSVFNSSRRARAFCSDAFSSREPVPTSLENALINPRVKITGRATSAPHQMRGGFFCSVTLVPRHRASARRGRLAGGLR